MRIFATLTKHIAMHLHKVRNTIIGLAALILLAGCQPKGSTAKINALQSQVRKEAKALDKIESRYLAQLEKDFLTYDSLLQYLHPDEVDQAFEELQLIGAYIEQFKATKPIMEADIDSTLLQLDRLKADAESHYLNDSLVNVYLADEAQHVDKLSSQVAYFDDRLSDCRTRLNNLKKQK